MHEVRIKYNLACVLMDWVGRYLMQADLEKP